jgi:hypothetical protein
MRARCGPNAYCPLPTAYCPRGPRGRGSAAPKRCAVGSARIDARNPRPRDRLIDGAVAGGVSLSEAARPPAWRPSRCSERSGSRALPPFHVRRASPPVLRKERRRITLDHPASHRLNSGSDWPSSRRGEGSLGAVRGRSDRFGSILCGALMALEFSVARCGIGRMRIPLTQSVSVIFVWRRAAPWRRVAAALR